MKEKKGESKKIILISIIISILLLTLVIVAFVYFSNNKPQEIINETLNGGEVSLTYSDEDSSFSILKATPTSDITGKKLDSADKYFDFTVTSTIKEANKIEYEIFLDKLEELSSIKDEDIKIYLEKQKKGTYVSVFEPNKFEGLKKKSKLGTDKGSMVIYSGSIEDDSTENYRLRLWLSDKALVNSNISQDYSVEIGISAKAK